MGPVERRLVEKTRVFPLEDFWPDRSPNGVVALVAQNSSCDQHDSGHGIAHQPRAAHGTHHKQQRVPGQKRHDHHAGFNKNDQKQQGVNPPAVVLHKHLQVFVYVQDEVEQERNEFHGPGLSLFSSRA